MPIAASKRATNSNTGVVIPVFHRAKTLLRTLPYVLAQTAPPRELVIVDDGSTDDSADVAERWLAEHRPLFEWQVVRSKHVGAAAARNVGLAALGQSRYVAFLDSDDHWPADFLARTSALLDTSPSAVAASVDRRYLRFDGSLVSEDDCSALARDPIVWMFIHGAGIASCTLFRRDFVHQAGDWPAELKVAEDLKLFTEVAQRGTWLHSPGMPVDFDLGSAAVCGEAGNLSERYDRGGCRWVHIYEQIYQELCDRKHPIDHGACHLVLARIWNRAGKFFSRQGDRREALKCFINSIRWKPSLWRAWRRLVLTAMLPPRSAIADKALRFVAPPQVSVEVPAE